MKVYLILALAISFNALANILMKVGMNRVGGFGFNLKELISKFALNPVVVLGVFCFVLALIFYGYVLSQINLSVAYPVMTSIGYCIVILASWGFLRESISPIQVIGFAFIVAGVWMVTR